MHVHLLAASERGRESFEGGGRGKNALSGSDEHVIRGEGVICSFIWFIPLDVFCSTVGAASLQEMEVSAEPGRPSARLRDATPQQAGPLMSASAAPETGRSERPQNQYK